MCEVTGIMVNNPESFSQHSFYQIKPRPAPLLYVLSLSNPRISVYPEKRPQSYNIEIYICRTVQGVVKEWELCIPFLFLERMLGITQKENIILVGSQYNLSLLCII